MHSVFGWWFASASSLRVLSNTPSQLVTGLKKSSFLKLSIPYQETPHLFMKELNQMDRFPEMNQKKKRVGWIPSSPSFCVYWIQIRGTTVLTWFPGLFSHHLTFLLPSFTFLFMSDVPTSLREDKNLFSRGKNLTSTSSSKDPREEGIRSNKRWLNLCNFCLELCLFLLYVCCLYQSHRENVLEQLLQHNKCNDNSNEISCYKGSQRNKWSVHHLFSGRRKTVMLGWSRMFFVSKMFPQRGSEWRP